MRGYPVIALVLLCGAAAYGDTDTDKGPASQPVATSQPEPARSQPSSNPVVMRSQTGPGAATAPATRPTNHLRDNILWVAVVAVLLLLGPAIVKAVRKWLSRPNEW